MTTGSVMFGRAEFGWMKNGPTPGMANVTVSFPGKALATLSARRSEPGPLFFVVVTTVVGGVAATFTLRANSEVLAPCEVDVAEMNWPVAMTFGIETLKLALPCLSVVTVVKPR